MVGCSVIGCKSRSERKIPGITFHSFPSNPGTRAKWVSSSGKLNWTPTKRIKICSIHFDDKALIYKNKIVLLERNSVPTKHIHIKIPGTQDQHFMQQENIFSSQPLTSQHNIINNRPSSTKRSSDILIEIQNIQTKKKCLMNLIKKCVTNLAPLMRSLRRISNGNIKAKIQPTMSLAAAQEVGKRIVWLDLEMTGLNIDTDHILEIAVLVTNAQLSVVAYGPNLVIHQPDEILNNMSPWCIAQHGESGLTEASRHSNITLIEAENQILKFLKANCPAKFCPVAGNSVYMDRLFLRKYMPKVDEHLHYRIIDVSTIKELGKRWFPKEFSEIPQKKFMHRSMDDVMDSIAELRYYRESMFKK